MNDLIDRLSAMGRQGGMVSLGIAAGCLPTGILLSWLGLTVIEGRWFPALVGFGGAMLLVGTIRYLNAGTQHPFRGRWTPLDDGRVRQFFEQQDDEGQWQTWFEGFYSR